MGKWVIALVALVGVMGILIWQLDSDGPPKIEVPTYDGGPTVAPVASDARPLKPRVLRGDAKKGEDAAVAKYDPQSVEFSREVDVSIPNNFRAKLARCERKGVDPDAQITISYTLHIDQGVVSASNVRVAKSDLGDATLEQCMVTAVDQARWVASDMPDFMEEDTDLIIRMRSLNKYLSEDEQEEAKDLDKALAPTGAENEN
jgi:hypothetical protein